MPTKAKSNPLNRRLAVFLALASKYLLSCIGVYWLIHTNDWSFFPGFHGHDATTIMQIGAFYLAFTGAQLPAAAFASMFISLSDFRHPLRATFWTVAAYHLVGAVVSAVRWPWKSAPDLDQSVPIIASLISILIVIGFSVFITWFMPEFHRFNQRYFTR
jgi:hypothetical protein